MNLPFLKKKGKTKMKCSACGTMVVFEERATKVFCQNCGTQCLGAEPKKGNLELVLDFVERQQDKRRQEKEEQRKREEEKQREEEERKRAEEEKRREGFKKNWWIYLLVFVGLLAFTLIMSYFEK